MVGYPLLRKGRALWFFDCAGATLWLCCFLRLLILLPLVGQRFLPAGMADFFHVVAVIPLVELVVVRTIRRSWGVGWRGWIASLVNAVRMVWLCYGVIFVSPKIAKHTAYSMLIAGWSVAYLIHYVYYAFKLKFRTTPYLLWWLKNNEFFVTVPVLMGAEMVLLFLLLKFGDWWLNKAALLAYVPAGYFWWGYLLDRRLVRYEAVSKARDDRDRQLRNRLNVAVAGSSATVNGATFQSETIKMANLGKRETGSQTGGHTGGQTEGQN